MADHRRREESAPLVPPRSLGNQTDNRQSYDSAEEQPSWHGSTRTQDDETTQVRPAEPAPAERDDAYRADDPGRADEAETEKTAPLVAAAAAVAAAKERAMGPSRRSEDVSRSEDQVEAASSARPGRTRRARLRLVRVDPWSVMKTAFLLSIAFGIMCVVAVFIIWSVLGAANVFDAVNASVEQVLDESFALQDYIGMDRVLSITMLIAVLDVVLLTAIATLGAFLYNLAASLLGGLEVTLAEDEH